MKRCAENFQSTGFPFLIAPARCAVCAVIGLRCACALCAIPKSGRDLPAPCAPRIVRHDVPCDAPCDAPFRKVFLQSRVAPTAPRCRATENRVDSFHLQKSFLRECLAAPMYAPSRIYPNTARGERKLPEPGSPELQSTRTHECRADTARKSGQIGEIVRSTLFPRPPFWGGRGFLRRKKPFSGTHPSLRFIVPYYFKNIKGFSIFSIHCTNCERIFAQFYHICPA